MIIDTIELLINIADAIAVAARVSKTITVHCLTLVLSNKHSILSQLPFSTAPITITTVTISLESKEIESQDFAGSTNKPKPYAIGEQQQL